MPASSDGAWTHSLLSPACGPAPRILSSRQLILAGHHKAKLSRDTRSRNHKPRTNMNGLIRPATAPWPSAGVLRPVSAKYPTTTAISAGAVRRDMAMFPHEMKRPACDFQISAHGFGAAATPSPSERGSPYLNASQKHAKPVSSEVPAGRVIHAANKTNVPACASAMILSSISAVGIESATREGRPTSSVVNAAGTAAVLPTRTTRSNFASTLGTRRSPYLMGAELGAETNTAGTLTGICVSRAPVAFHTSPRSVKACKLRSAGDSTGIWHTAALTSRPARSSFAGTGTRVTSAKQQADTASTTEKTLITERFAATAPLPEETQPATATRAPATGRVATLQGHHLRREASFTRSSASEGPQPIRKAARTTSVRPTTAAPRLHIARKEEAPTAAPLRSAAAADCTLLPNGAVNCTAGPCQKRRHMGNSAPSLPVTGIIQPCLLLEGTACFAATQCEEDKSLDATVDYMAGLICRCPACIKEACSSGDLTEVLKRQQQLANGCNRPCSIQALPSGEEALSHVMENSAEAVPLTSHWQQVTKLVVQYNRLLHQEGEDACREQRGEGGAASDMKQKPSEEGHQETLKTEKPAAPLLKKNFSFCDSTSNSQKLLRRRHFAKTGRVDGADNLIECPQTRFGLLRATAKDKKIDFHELPSWITRATSAPQYASPALSSLHVQQPQRPPSPFRFSSPPRHSRIMSFSPCASTAKNAFSAREITLNHSSRRNSAAKETNNSTTNMSHDQCDEHREINNYLKSGCRELSQSNGSFVDCNWSKNSSDTTFNSDKNNCCNKSQSTYKHSRSSSLNGEKESNYNCRSSISTCDSKRTPDSSTVGGSLAGICETLTGNNGVSSYRPLSGNPNIKHNAEDKSNGRIDNSSQKPMSSECTFIKSDVDVPQSAAEIEEPIQRKCTAARNTRSIGSRRNSSSSDRSSSSFINNTSSKTRAPVEATSSLYQQQKKQRLSAASKREGRPMSSSSEKATFSTAVTKDNSLFAALSNSNIERRYLTSNKGAYLRRVKR